jgi:hypothetical protein
MDRVRFGRALGFGARQAVKTLVTAVDAATAENPSSKGAGQVAARPQATARPQAPAAPQIQTPTHSRVPVEERRQMPIQVDGQAGNGRNFAGSGAAAKVVDTAGRAAVQARVTKQGLRRGSRRFGEAMWAPFVRLSGVLWLEITGVFFGIFALFALGAMWKLRGEWHATATNVEGHRSLLGAVAMLVVFGYFCVSSFVRARRRERGR